MWQSSCHTVLSLQPRFFIVVISTLCLKVKNIVANLMWMYIFNTHVQLFSSHFFPSSCCLPSLHLWVVSWLSVGFAAVYHQPLLPPLRDLILSLLSLDWKRWELYIQLAHPTQVLTLTHILPKIFSFSPDTYAYTCTCARTHTHTHTHTHKTLHLWFG